MALPFTCNCCFLNIYIKNHCKSLNSTCVNRLVVFVFLSTAFTNGGSLYLPEWSSCYLQLKLYLHLVFKFASCMLWLEVASVTG